MFSRILRLSVIATLVLVASCSNQQSESSSSSSSSSTPAGGGAAAEGDFSIAGAQFDVPDAWEDLGASQMRQAQYRLAAVGDDTDPAEVNVFFFGAQMGGDIESNIRRWIGQMQTPEGGDASASAIRSKLTTNGFDVHFVEVDGTYMQSMGGGPMTGGRKKAMPGYRMVAAIVEAPGGNVFIKLTGPEATARKMEEGLREMIGSVREAGA